MPCGGYEPTKKVVHKEKKATPKVEEKQPERIPEFVPDFAELREKVKA